MALGPLRPAVNVVERSIKEKSVVAGVKGEVRDTFNQFGAMDTAERYYREGFGVPRAALEGGREHLANMVASVVPVRDIPTMLDSSENPWVRAEAAANTVAKTAGLALGILGGGAPRAGVLEEGLTGARVAPAETSAVTADLVQAETRAAAGAAGGTAASSGASADASVVGKLTYRHQVKAGRTTDIADLKAQIGREVDTMNEIIGAEGIEGLQQRVLAYRADPGIEAAGRAHVRTLGPAGCTDCGDPLAWVHRLDMSKGGSPTDVSGKGLLRNNSIIGGQANRLADEILAMPSGTTRIEWELVLKQARVKTSQ
jgi:hypothetical protein